MTALYYEIVNNNDSLRKIYLKIKDAKDNANHDWQTKDIFFLLKIIVDLEKAHKNIIYLALNYQNDAKLFNEDLIAFFTLFMGKENIDILRLTQGLYQSLADSALQNLFEKAREKKNDASIQSKISHIVHCDNFCNALYSNLKNQIDQVISKEEKHGITDDIFQLQIDPVPPNPPAYNPAVVSSTPQASYKTYSHRMKTSTLLEAKHSIALQADENSNMNPYQRFLIRRALQLQAEFVECRKKYENLKGIHDGEIIRRQLYWDNNVYKSQLWELYKYFVPEIPDLDSSYIPSDEVCLIVPNDTNTNLDPTLVKIKQGNSKNVGVTIESMDSEMKTDDIFALAMKSVETYINEQKTDCLIHLTGTDKVLKNAMKAYIDAMRDLVKDENERNKYKRYEDDLSFREKIAHLSLVSKMKKFIRKNGLEGLSVKVVFTRKTGATDNAKKYEEIEGTTSQYYALNSKLGDRHGIAANLQAPKDTKEESTALPKSSLFQPSAPPLDIDGIQESPIAERDPQSSTLVLQQLNKPQTLKSRPSLKLNRSIEGEQRQFGNIVIPPLINLRLAEKYLTDFQANMNPSKEVLIKYDTKPGALAAIEAVVLMCERNDIKYKIYFDPGSGLEKKYSSHLDPSIISIFSYLDQHFQPITAQQSPDTLMLTSDKREAKVAVDNQGMFRKEISSNRSRPKIIKDIESMKKNPCCNIM